MDLKDIPIGKKIVATNEDFIKITVERIDEQTVIISNINPHTSQEVMRTHVNVETGHSALETIDTNFWDIYINGEKFEGYSFRLLYQLDENKREGKKNSMESDPKTRTIKIMIQ